MTAPLGLAVQRRSPRQADETWLDVLHTRAKLQPDLTAFTWLSTDAGHDTSISYAELDCRARAIGALLQHTGPPGERALLLMPPGLDFVEGSHDRQPGQFACASPTLTNCPSGQSSSRVQGNSSNFERQGPARSISRAFRHSPVRFSLRLASAKFCDLAMTPA